jgi:hypothetical protein
MPCTIILSLLTQHLDDWLALDICAASLSALLELHILSAAACLGNGVGCAHGGLVVWSVSEEG